MDNVYLLTSGDYSDYAIHGVFSTREKAEAAKGYCEQHRGIGGYRVEEHTMDPEPEEHLGGYTATLYIDSGDHYDEPRWHHYVNPARDPHVYGFAHKRVRGYGKTPEQATRRVAEYRRRVLADPRSPADIAEYE